MQPEYYGRQTRNSRNSTERRRTRNRRSNTACRTGNSQSNMPHRTKTHLAFSQANSQAHNFLFCYCDSFVKLLTASTAFETVRQQNANNNGHRRTTKERRRRTDVGEARTLRKVMSTPATRNTDGSAGGSTKGAQSVRLTSGGTASGGTEGR